MLYDGTEVTEDIECDGRKISSRRDPPGQKSNYILPGDPERETYRLSTFNHYPRDSPMDPREFAACGFYYTGYKDRVKCFSCGQFSDNWLMDDDIASPQWHDFECDFMRGRDSSNIPILAFLRQQQIDRQSSLMSTSFVNQAQSSVENSQSNLLCDHNVAGGSSTSSSRVSADNLCRNDSHSNTSHTSRCSNNSILGREGSLANPTTSVNHNFTSPVNQVSMISHTPTAGEVLASWTPPKIPINHENLSQNVCQFPSKDKENVGRSSSANLLLPDNKENRLNMFPCLHPQNPHMRTTKGRLQTFLDNASIWPAHRIRSTPRQIVDAGMYYLGERDRVKCWYCNGGLQNWERDDDPWEEHAKWFPLCEYALQQKGPDYVHQIVARFPGLRRPTLYNPSTSPAAQTLVRNLHISPNQVNSSSNSLLQNLQTTAMEIVDPRKEIVERNRKISEDMRSSDDVAQARMMGFNDDVIRNVLQRKYETTIQGFPDFLSFVDAILSISADNQPVDPCEESTAASRPPSSGESCAVTPLQEMRKLEESRRCKRCHREDACVVFIPCGHLACCVACSDRVKRCPVCRETIREKVRSYLS